MWLAILLLALEYTIPTLCGEDRSSEHVSRAPLITNYLPEMTTRDGQKQLKLLSSPGGTGAALNIFLPPWARTVCLKVIRRWHGLCQRKIQHHRDDVVGVEPEAGVLS